MRGNRNLKPAGPRPFLGLAAARAKFDPDLTATLAHDETTPPRVVQGDVRVMQNGRHAEAFLCQKGLAPSGQEDVEGAVALGECHVDFSISGESLSTSSGRAVWDVELLQPDALSMGFQEVLGETCCAEV